MPGSGVLNDRQGTTISLGRTAASSPLRALQNLWEPAPALGLPVSLGQRRSTPPPGGFYYAVGPRFVTAVKQSPEATQGDFFLLKWLESQGNFSPDQAFPP